jgi:hypothetical protein
MTIVVIPTREKISYTRVVQSIDNSNIFKFNGSIQNSEIETRLLY